MILNEVPEKGEETWGQLILCSVPSTGRRCPSVERVTFSPDAYPCEVCCWRPWVCQGFQMVDSGCFLPNPRDPSGSPDLSAASFYLPHVSESVYEVFSQPKYLTRLRPHSSAAMLDPGHFSVRFAVFLTIPWVMRLFYPSSMFQLLCCPGHGR